MIRNVYLTCEENGLAGAERAAARHKPGGDMYVPGNRVTIEHGMIPCAGSELPNCDSYGKTEPGYRIIVENDGKDGRQAL